MCTIPLYGFMALLGHPPSLSCKCTFCQPYEQEIKRKMERERGREGEGE